MIRLYHVSKRYEGDVAAVALALSTALILCVEGPFWATMNDLAGERSGLGGGIMNTGRAVGIEPVPVILD